ncbi:MAG: HpsJ family protein [Cyanobacteriota bacterium]|nr:HpsJ family protein [Cyanobacteriota bacterium]
MKATRRQPSSLAALALKWVGIILILSYILDALVEPLPYQFLLLSWRIQALTQLVDKGIIALMGIAMLFAGDWIDANTTNSAPASNKLLDLRFWALIFSTILGVLFFVLAPLHILDVNRASNQQLSRIEQEAQQAETQLESQLGSEDFQQQLEQRKAVLKQQIGVLLENEEQLNEALENDQLPEEIKAVLEESKTNPQVLEEFLEEQAQALPAQLETQLREQQQTLQKQTRLTSWKSSLRVGLSSWLLSAGYTMIGWTGLRGMLGNSPRVSRQAPMS